VKLLEFFATCPRGLEAVLQQELQQLKAQHIKPTEGGLSFAGDWALCYRVNLHSRIATRVMWRVAQGSYANEQDLYNAAMALDWSEWFDVKRTMMVKVTAVKSPVKSLEFVTLRIKDAICDKFRQRCNARPSIDTREPDVRVHVFLTQQHYQFYLDTSGQALYQRGQRRNSVSAPLRENLAAGILALTGWQAGMPLLDPMCGSGTFVLEAAMMALNIAPGSQRQFGFEQLNSFDSKIWQHIREQAQSQAKPVSFQKIYASDMDLRAVRVARQNLAQAGLLQAVQLSHVEFTQLAPPAEQGVLVANPPYGVRIGEDEELAALYPKMAETLKRKFAGWTAYFLTNDLRMPKLMRLTPSKKTPLFNGPLECRLFEIKLVAGSNRKSKSDPTGAEHEPR